MAQGSPIEKTTNGFQAPLKLDAAVVGAGVAGLNQLHLLRQQGLAVKAFDAASDVGGTWYWNRYPGARFDSESYCYQYLFSEDLYKGWSWSEKFPAQPEIERWLHYVTDKLDLRRDIQFNTTIKSAHFNEATGRWTITTGQGQVIDAQYLVTCCGMLSAPLSSLFPGQETFKGQLFHTARWPNEYDRSRRQARRRRRYRCDGNPGGPDDRRQGRSPDGVRPHAAIRPADEEPEIHAGGSGSLQVEVRVVRRASAAHLHRLRARFRKRVGGPDAGTAPRRAGGDLGGRFAQVLDRVLRQKCSSMRR